MADVLPQGRPENVVVLERMPAVRHGIARALGYDTWAAYQVEPRMAGRREAVEAFLADLRPRLAERAAADLAEFADGSPTGPAGTRSR